MEVACACIVLDDTVISCMSIGDRERLFWNSKPFAILVGIYLFNNELLGCDTVVFCDNNSVMASSISGKSANSLVALIANLSFQWEDRAEVVL